MTKRKNPKPQRQSASTPESPAGPMPAAIGVGAAKKVGVDWKWFAILTFVVGAVPFLLYTNTLWYGLIFHDSSTLGACATTDAGLFDTFLRPFTQPYVKSSFVTDMTHYKAEFGWYHLVNVWVHLSSAVALFFVVFTLARKVAAAGSRLSAPYAVAALSALIYGCHPLAAQSASYLSARWSALGASNFLFAILFFMFVISTQGAIRVWSTLLLIMYAGMCLASSEVALVLVPTMVAVFYLLKPAKLTWSDWAIEHPLVSALTAVFSLSIPFYLLTGFQPAGTGNMYGLPILSPVAYYATGAKAFLTYYTRAFFAPLGLGIDPPFTQATGFADVLAIGGLILLIGCIYMMYRWRTQPLFFFGMWLTVFGFLPHAVIPQQDSVSDPAFYLSLAGLSVVASWLIFEVWRGPLAKEAPKAVAILVTLAALAVVHNIDFRSDSALTDASLKVNHRSVLATNLHAIEKLKKEDYAGAVQDADEAISIDPTSAMGYYVRGQAQTRAGQDTEAKHSLEKAAELAAQQKLSTLAAIKYALAESYIAMDRLDKANEVANEAFKLEPSNGRGVYVLGLMSLKRRDYQVAMTYLKAALQQGVIEARLPLARALLGMKEYDGAEMLASRSLAIKDTPETQLILGNAALAQNKLEVAEKALKEALKGKRDSIETMALLSILYQRRGDKVLAQSYHNDAAARDPQIFSQLLMPR